MHIEYPAWVAETVDWERTYESDEDRMRLAIVGDTVLLSRASQYGLLMHSAR